MRFILAELRFAPALAAGPISGQSIVSMIAQRIPPTLSLMILTLLISVSVAVPPGVDVGAR